MYPPAQTKINMDKRYLKNIINDLSKIGCQWMNNVKPIECTLSECNVAILKSMWRSNESAFL